MEKNPKDLPSPVKRQGFLVTSGSYYFEDGQEVSGSGGGEGMWSACPGQDGGRGPA